MIPNDNDNNKPSEQAFMFFNSHKLKDRPSSIKEQRSFYKDVIRRRAFENVKEKRQKLLESIREHEKDVCAELFEKYTKECKEELERLLIQEKGNMDEDEYMDLLIEIGNEIEEEIKKEEEELLLKEFEENEKIESEDLQELIDYFEKSVFLCPICKKNRLLETKHSLFCKCGLRIPTKYDGLSASDVSQNLIDNFVEHKQQCDKEPTINSEQKFGSTFLSMSCKECGYFGILI
ncbi:hypothetical protein ABK040_006713 [Willaertia magna]